MHLFAHSITIPTSNNKQKHLRGKMKCDVGMITDRDVVEKRYEIKVGMPTHTGH